MSVPIKKPSGSFQVWSADDWGKTTFIKYEPPSHFMVVGELHFPVNKLPNRWHRFWLNLFFGFEWKSAKD